jgi:hypothetical protein
LVVLKAEAAWTPIKALAVSFLASFPVLCPANFQAPSRASFRVPCPVRFLVPFQASSPVLCQLLAALRAR